MFHKIYIRNMLKNEKERMKTVYLLFCIIIFCVFDCRAADTGTRESQMIKKWVMEVEKGVRICKMEFIGEIHGFSRLKIVPITQKLKKIETFFPVNSDVRIFKRFSTLFWVHFRILMLKIQKMSKKIFFESLNCILLESLINLGFKRLRTTKNAFLDPPN